MFTEQTIDNMTLGELVKYAESGDIPCHPTLLEAIKNYIDTKSEQPIGLRSHD